MMEETRMAAKHSEPGGVHGEGDQEGGQLFRARRVLGETSRAAEHSEPGGVVEETRRLA